MAATTSSQRAQEVDQVLLVRTAQQVEVVYHAVCLRALAGMRLDGPDNIVGAAVMQEEEALPDTPQRCTPELASIGTTLGHPVLETCAHVVHREVAVRPERHIALPCHVGLAGLLTDGMAGGTADIREHLRAGGYRRAGRR